MPTRLALALVLGLVLVACSAVATGAEHGAQEGGGLNPIPTTLEEIRADLALWTGVIFLVLFVVLWKFAWGPIVRGLNNREQGIADQIEQAERSNADARRLLDEYQQKLAASGEEVQRMLDDARREAQQVGHEIVEKARSDAEAEHERALEEIELATAGALKELAEQSATLAVGLAGKIVRAKLDPQAHSQLIEQAVADFSRKRPDDSSSPR